MESDGNRCLDARIRVITLKLEVLQLVLEDARGLAFDHQRRQRAGLPLQLLEDDVIGQMVLVQVTVAKGMHELTNLQVALLGNHVREQSVGGNIERHPLDLHTTIFLHNTPGWVDCKYT